MFDKVLNTPLLVHLEYTNVALNSDIFSVNLGHIAKKASYQSNISNIIIKMLMCVLLITLANLKQLIY